jgi:energy-coupling factor transporter ATP-binding protein EcfA2
MGHIDDFHIQGFRGLRDLKIANLGQINLFVGNNNSGKTSVLEAASLFCDPFNWRRWYDLAGQRELVSGQRTTIMDRLSWFFPAGRNDTQNLASESPKIELSASGDFTTEYVSVSYAKFAEVHLRPAMPGEEQEEVVEGISLKTTVYVRDSPSKSRIIYEDIAPFSQWRIPVQYPSRSRIPTLPVQIVSLFSHRTGALTSQLWSGVVEADLKEETIKLLRFFDPAIEDVDILSPSEHSQILSIKHKRLGRAPLSTFGDGLRRVFTLATSIPRARNGLLLIDELETAIHTKALEKTFDWLVEACVSNNIQLLATTHSLEALDTILDVSRENADFVVYRLQQDEKQTTAKRFDKEMTLRLREELGMEMRY